MNVAAGRYSIMVIDFMFIDNTANIKSKLKSALIIGIICFKICARFTHLQQLKSEITADEFFAVIFFLTLPLF